MARRLDREPRKQHPRFTPEPGFRTKWLPRLIIASGLVVVAVLLLTAVRLGDTSDADAPLDQAVDSLFPANNTLEPRQTAVTIDLATGWTLEQLVIDGVGIAEEFIDDGGAPLGIYTYVPRAGTPFEAFDVGEIVVLAIIQNQLNASDQRTIAWSFTST
ncbi:MAG: hypothetical protein GXP35_07805 [Actinobacteria bacterium]|nr:hypothetical protein [Actinomycetota bacterium]